VSSVPREIVELEAEHGRSLQMLFDADPDYFRRFHGHEVGAEAQSTFTALPPGSTYEHKLLFGAS
jgi:hypothetical protein